MQNASSLVLCTKAESAYRAGNITDMMCLPTSEKQMRGKSFGSNLTWNKGRVSNEIIIYELNKICFEENVPINIHMV